jgi:DNA-binding MarR family transcriptional regulator
MWTPSDVPTQEILSTCAADHARRAARTITRAYDQALAPCGLTITQFTMLVMLSRRSFDSITEMADELALERSSLSRNLSRLDQRDLVQRTDDGRARRITITEAGRDKVQEAYPLWRETQRQVEDELGWAEWGDARMLLRRLADMGASL